jgi:hypothetical protein
MLTTVKGYYDHGKIVLNEDVSVAEKTEVIVTFLDEEGGNKKKLRIPGALKGKVTIPDDFNDPLDDFKAYM